MIAAFEWVRQNWAIASQAMALLAFLAALNVAVFLLLREFFCWYWKINKRSRQLAEIQEELARIRMELERPRT